MSDASRAEELARQAEVRDLVVSAYERLLDADDELWEARELLEEWSSLSRVDVTAMTLALVEVERTIAALKEDIGREAV